MGYYAQAQLFGPVMVRYGLDEAAVGLMMSKEVMAYALTALLLAGPVTRFSRARIALLGAAIVFISNVIAGYTENFEVLSVARLAAGFGAGMIGAAGTAAAASSINPQRFFAIISVSWGVVAAIPPILTESGGRFTDWKGTATASGGDGVGTNGRLHDATLELLRDG